MSERFPTILLLALLGCVPLLSLLVMPIMVGAFVDDLGLSERDAGFLASAAYVGSTLAALVLALRVHKINLRKLALVGLLAMLLGDGLSVFAASMPIELLTVLRFIAGAGSAAAYASVMAAYARLKEPDRGYGTFMAMQFAISGMGLYGLPHIMPLLGAEGLFGLFAFFNLAGLTLISLLPTDRARVNTGGPEQLEWQYLLTFTAIFCLLAIGIFEAAQLGQFAYIERIGVNMNLEPGEIGLALGIASFAGIPAAFSVTWLGSRFGYFKPIAAVCTVQIAVMYWLIHANGFNEYLVIACLFGMGWAIGLPYFQGMAARIDTGGSVVVACGFATSAAGFVGPAGAALLVRPGNYSMMLWGVMLCLALVIVLTWLVTRRINMDNAVEL